MPSKYFKKTKLRIEEMIKKHQRLPGSIFNALFDRFRKYKLEWKNKINSKSINYNNHF